MRRNFYRGVNAAAGGAADQQGDVTAAEVFVFLHFASHVLHFFQARRNQAGEADDVRVLFLGLGQNLVAGHHDAHVDNVKVVALQNHSDDVFADVVHIALDGGNHDLALGLGFSAGFHHGELFGLDVGQQVRHRALHHPRALYHLRQEHLALPEQVAHHVHAVHQRAFDHMQRAAALGQNGAVGLLGVVVDEVGNAVHQRMAQPLRDRHRRPGRAAPFELFALVFGAALRSFGNLNQALAGRQKCLAGLVGGGAVEHHVFHPLPQNRLQIVIHPHHAGVDDAHVHAGLNRVVQEHGVNRLAHRVVPAEAEGHIRHAARHLGARQVLLDPAGGVDEVHRVVVVLLDAGGNGKNIGVEDDVLGRKVHLVHQHPVGPLADLDLAGVGIGLAFFIKRHHHCRRTIAAQEFGLTLELVQALFHADGVHHRLALHAAQARLNHAPLGAVDHDGHARDVRLRGNQVQESHHGGLAVEHGLVHVDVDDLRAVFHLLTRHRQRLLELPVQNHARKGLGAGDVGALAHVHKQASAVEGDGLQTREPHRRYSFRSCLRSVGGR